MKRAWPQLVQLVPLSPLTSDVRGAFPRGPEPQADNNFTGRRRGIGHIGGSMRPVQGR